MIRMFTVILFVATLTSAAPGAIATAAQEGSRPAAGAPAAAPVNLNTATVAQLESMPGIGKATAERIVEYRQKNGNFKKAEDLMNIRGIGEKSFLTLKPLVTVAAVKGER